MLVWVIYVVIENQILNEQNKKYQNKLDHALKVMESYEDEIKRSVFELDIYRNQVDRLTNLTKSQERVISYLHVSKSPTSNQESPLGHESVLEDGEYEGEGEEEEEEPEYLEPEFHDPGFSDYANMPRGYPGNYED